MFFCPLVLLSVNRSGMVVQFKCDTWRQEYYGGVVLEGQPRILMPRVTAVGDWPQNRSLNFLHDCTGGSDLSESAVSTGVDTRELTKKLQSKGLLGVGPGWDRTFNPALLDPTARPRRRRSPLRYRDRVGECSC